MSTLDLCEHFFNTRDIYTLLDVAKDASEKAIKKGYYKLSLQVHPDRVRTAEKEVATEKFKVLSKIYQVLTDKDKRALYDEQGTIDDDDMEGKLTTWLDLWRKIFKPLTEEDIGNYEKTYTDSELERNDIKKAYLSGQGCINHMMNEVPFMKVEDEPRIQNIVKALIASGDVPEYKIFTEEPKAKRNRRHKKYARESKEADQIKEKLKAKNKASTGGGSLEQQIMSRQQSRESNYNSLMDHLMEKYGDEDDDDVVDFEALDKKHALKKKRSTQKKTAKPNIKVEQSGRVKKHKKN